MKKRTFIIIGFLASIISIFFGTVALLHIHNQKKRNNEEIKTIEAKTEETLKRIDIALAKLAKM